MVRNSRPPARSRPYHNSDSGASKGMAEAELAATKTNLEKETVLVTY
jgi:hypothetical protein